MSRLETVQPRGETSIESPTRPVLTLMSGRTIGFAASFFIPVALARIFDQSEFGTYKQLFLIATTLWGIGQLGMAESLFYFLPRTPQAGPRYVMNAVLALTGGGLACLLALELGGGLITRWLANPELGRHTTLLGLYLLFWLPSATLEIVMIVRKRYRWASASYAALDLLRAVLLVVPALVMRELEWLLTGAVVFAAIRCAVSLWYLRWEFDGGMRPDRELLRQQLAYAVPFQFSGVLEIVQSNLHQYVVAASVASATFAIYSVGCLQIPLVDVAFVSVVNVMMVRMAEELRDGHGRAALSIWHDSSRKLALLFFPLAALLMVTARPIIVFLFTERYAASSTIFMLSSLALFLSPLMVEGVLRVYAETRVLFALNLVRLVVTIGLLSVLIGRLGLPGAILSTLIAAAIARTLGLARVAMLMKVGVSDLLPWRDFAKIGTAALAAACGATTAMLVAEWPPLPSIVLAGLVYGAIYVAAVWWLGALRERERAALRARLAGWGLPAAARRDA